MNVDNLAGNFCQCLIRENSSNQILSGAKWLFWLASGHSDRPPDFIDLSGSTGIAVGLADHFDGDGPDHQRRHPP